MLSKHTVKHKSFAVFTVFLFPWYTPLLYSPPQGWWGTPLLYSPPRGWWGTPLLYSPPQSWRGTPLLYSPPQSWWGTPLLYSPPRGWWGTPRSLKTWPHPGQCPPGSEGSPNVCNERSRRKSMCKIVPRICTACIYCFASERRPFFRRKKNWIFSFTSSV